jgi:tRNA U54 and U55 pseudouridine synthase Pus10
MKQKIISVCSEMVNLVNEHISPCERMEVVCGREVYNGRHPTSKESWDAGVMKVIERVKQTIARAVGKKCRERWSNRFSQGPTLQLIRVPVGNRQLLNLRGCSKL